MTRVRVALRVPVGRPLPDLAAFVVRCEEAGFDGVGIHDHPSSGRDAYLALALASRGLDVDVYEQSSELREVGAGVQIGPNGSRVLNALGLREAVERLAVIPAHRELRHWATGETWNYLFYVETAGHFTDRPLVMAFEEMKRITRFFKVLGSYPRP